MLSAEHTTILAACVLGALGLCLACWVAVSMRRSSYTPAQACVFGLNYLLARILWRVRIEGRLEAPPGRGAIIVCNHRCPADPSFTAVAAGRIVHWMVAKEYSDFPAFGWFLRICQVIPVNRGGIDTAATKLAIRLAQQGDLIGIFPEGRLNTSDELMLPGRPGAAMIALNAGVPVIPCYVSGSSYSGAILGFLLTPAKVRMKIGRPIDVSEYDQRDSDREAAEALTLRLMKEIGRLAGQEDFQPQLAGRFYRPDLVDD